MALQDLQKELNAIAEKIQKRGGGGGTNDPFRWALNRHTHTFKFSKVQITYELNNIYNRFQNDDSSKGRLTSKQGKARLKKTGKDRKVKAFGADQRQLIIDFAEPFLKELTKECHTLKNSGTLIWTVDENYARTIVSGDTIETTGVNIYKQLSDALGRASATMKTQFQGVFDEIFRRGSQEVGGSSILNVGHTIGVVTEKVFATEAALANIDPIISDVGERLQKKVKAFKDAWQIRGSHAIKIKNGEIIGNLTIDTDIQSWWYNQQVAQRKETQMGKALQQKTQKGKNPVQTLMQELQDEIADEYKKAKAGGEVKRKRSTPFRVMVGQALVDSKVLKRLIRKGIAKNTTKYQKPAKGKRAIVATKDIKSNNKVYRHEFTSLLGHFGSMKSKSRGSKQHESTTMSGENYAPLMALLNRKLPDAIAKNMGAPALEYRTGMFAGSAKIVNMVAGVNGVPVIDYSYQKTPYRVFEEGAGKAPWATAGRDPRVIIDKSIREIAIEMAVGRFTTRRV